MAEKTPGALNPAVFPPAELAAYIVAVHHGFLRRELPRLHAMSERVAQVHGGHTPSLVEMFRVFVGMETESSSPSVDACRPYRAHVSCTDSTWAFARILASAQAITFRAFSPPEIANSIVAIGGDWGQFWSPLNSAMLSTKFPTKFPTKASPLWYL
jgi:hypothetical protein